MLLESIDRLLDARHLTEGLPVSALSGIHDASKHIFQKWEDSLEPEDYAQMIVALTAGAKDKNKAYENLMAGMKLVRK